MSEITLTTTADGLVLVHGEDLLGRYRVSDDSITPVNTPKPYFHPLHTLGGAQITDFAPDDHPWHHGLQFAFPRVGAHNLWGGGTYFGPERGYVVVDDQGRIDHDTWTDVDESAGTFAHRLSWIGHDGQPLLSELRRHRIHTVTTGAAAGWMMHLDTTLTNATGEDLPLETPAQRGRDDGGYGGWFLRLADGFAAENASADGQEVTESGAHADTFVFDGRTARGEPVTIGMHYGPDTSPGARAWLHRFEPFPLAGFAVAYDEGLVVPAGGELRFSHRLACFDGVISHADITALLRG